MKRILTTVLTGILVFSAFSVMISDAVKADPLPAPAIGGVDPASPWEHSPRQPFSILGSNFVPGLVVTLTDPNDNEFEIPRPANPDIETTPDRINVQASFVPAGTWTVNVTNPDGQPSNVYSFSVRRAVRYAADWGEAANNGWHNPLGKGTELNTSQAYDFDSGKYLLNWGMRHAGLDFMADYGTKVYAIADGTVQSITGSDLNERIWIKHDTTEGAFFAVYGHIAVNQTLKDDYSDPNKVAAVEFGQVIGTIKRYDPNNHHLHFGINVLNWTQIVANCNPPNNWGQTTPEIDPRDSGWRDPIVYLESHEASESTGGLVDVILIIDSSGSMGTNDPSKERLDAAEAFLTACLPGDQVGVVDFDTTAKLLGDGLYPLPENKDTLGSLIEGIDNSGGSTNMRDAITVSCQELSNDGSAPKRGAILLTDGKHNEGSFGNPQQCFVDNGWPIYTFGFGSADATLLQQIADETGGEYKHISEVTSLLCEFQRVRAMIAGAEPPPCIVDHVDPGETVTRFVEMPPNQAQATFSSNWLGSDIVMTLTTPSGRVIDRATVAPDVVHDKGADFEVYTIMNPEAGSWQVDLFGLDVPPGGEDVIFGFVSIPSGSQPPVADAGADQTVSVIPPASTAMVTLDGSGSYDPDGDPLTYNWTWDSNIADGVNPTVELPLGTTTITLIVNDGQVDSEPDTVDITVDTIEPPPTISYTPKFFFFFGRQDGENPQSRTLTIYNFGEEGCAPLEWTVSEGADWLTLSPTSGTTMRTIPGDQVDVSVNISDMTAGTYFAQITIDAPGATNTPHQLPVLLYIRPNLPPFPW